MSTTVARIQDAALSLFAKKGFVATSMADIATIVGIKKPSIYAHFKNKDQLFLSLIPLLIDKELTFAREQFQDGSDFKTQFYDYLASFAIRFKTANDTQFWFTTLFLPPEHLYDAVINQMHQFMRDLEAIFKEAITHSVYINNQYKLDADTLAITCMSYIDSLQSELLYAGEIKFKRRLDALWKVFDCMLIQESAYSQ